VIDLEEVRALAVARCFDVLEFDADAVAAHVLAGRFDPIAVLRMLEAIETRQNGPSRGAIGPATAHSKRDQRPRRAR
jgi:hypothetical protein